MNAVGREKEDLFATASLEREGFGGGQVVRLTLFYHFLVSESASTFTALSCLFLFFCASIGLTWSCGLEAGLHTILSPTQSRLFFPLSFALTASSCHLDFL